MVFHDVFDIHVCRRIGSSERRRLLAFDRPAHDAIVDAPYRLHLTVLRPGGEAVELRIDGGAGKVETPGVLEGMF